MPSNPTPLRYAPLVLTVILLSFFFDPFSCFFSFFSLYSLNFRLSPCCFSLTFSLFSFSSILCHPRSHDAAKWGTAGVGPLATYSRCCLHGEGGMLTPPRPPSPYSCCYVTALLFFFFFHTCQLSHVDTSCHPHIIRSPITQPCVC